MNLKVCETSLIVASGGMFMIPRGECRCFSPTLPSAPPSLPSLLPPGSPFLRFTSPHTDTADLTGNTYFIENIADRDAKLFFTQARKMREGEKDDEEEGEQPVPSSGGAAAAPRSLGIGRAASAGAGVKGVNGQQKGAGLRRGMSSNV